MTIDEAIGILIWETGDATMRPHLVEALKLGIEALKLVKELRECLPDSAVKLLPGETTDKGVT